MKLFAFNVVMGILILGVYAQVSESLGRDYMHEHGYYVMISMLVIFVGVGYVFLAKKLNQKKQENH